MYYSWGLCCPQGCATERVKCLRAEKIGGLTLRPESNTSTNKGRALNCLSLDSHFLDMPQRLRRNLQYWRNGAEYNSMVGQVLRPSGWGTSIDRTLKVIHSPWNLTTQPVTLWWFPCTIFADTNQHPNSSDASDPVLNKILGSNMHSNFFFIDTHNLPRQVTIFARHNPLAKCTLVKNLKLLGASFIAFGFNSWIYFVSYFGKWINLCIDRFGKGNLYRSIFSVLEITQLSSEVCLWISLSGAHIDRDRDVSIDEVMYYLDKTWSEYWH